MLPLLQAEKIFDTKGAFGTRGLVNKKGANHHEPSAQYNPALAKYTTSWFKVFLDQTKSGHGRNFYDELYGTGTDTLCHGGDGAMVACTIQ